MPNKHAYLIIAHHQFELLQVLIEMLDDERNDLFVHIDAKVQNFDFEKFKAIPKHSNIYFTDRVSVAWGDFSVVQCEMILFRVAVERQSDSNHYSYFHLISGVDLPIKSNSEIYDFFESNYPKEFIHFTNDEPLKEFESRVRYYHVLRKKRNTINKLIAQVALKAQKLFGVNRLKGSNLVVQKGSQWVSITDKLAEYLASNEEFIEKTFNYSYCSDEVFLQTMFVNSEFKDNVYMKNQNNNQLAAARLIDWDRGNPYVFKSSDFDEIINSPAMFARKFDLNVDKDVIYKIKDYVMGKE